MSCTSDAETESRTHDTIERSCEVLERSAEKSIVVPCARSKRSSLGSARGKRWGWRHSNVSKHVWSDRTERSTFDQTQFNSSKCDGTQQCGMQVLRIHEGRMLRTGSAKPFLRTGTCCYNFHSNADSSIAKAVASRRGVGKSTRHIQTRMLWLQERVAAKHLRVAKVATESNPADMLMKALDKPKMVEFCEEIGQTEPHAKTVDKTPKEAKRPKTVKFAVDTNDEMTQNKLKDSRVAMIKNESKDAKLR